MIFDKELLKQAIDATDESLIEKYKGGDNKALNTLIGRHQDLVKYKVNSHKNTPVPLPAVYGQGLKILATAAKRFEPNQDVKFRTFLESNLRGLNRYVHQNKNVLHFPANKMEKIRNFKQVHDLLSQQMGHEPSDWQMSDALGWSIPDVKEFRIKLRQGELASSGLDNVVGREQEDDSVRARREERSEFLYHTLTETEKKVYDFALGRHNKPKLKTDAQIAMRTGLSPSKVNRTRKELARKIQNS